MPDETSAAEHVPANYLEAAEQIVDFARRPAAYSPWGNRRGQAATAETSAAEAAGRIQKLLDGADSVETWTNRIRFSTDLELMLLRRALVALLDEREQLRARLDTIGLLLPVLAATVGEPWRNARSAELVVKAITAHHGGLVDDSTRDGSGA